MKAGKSPAVTYISLQTSFFVSLQVCMPFVHSGISAQIEKTILDNLRITRATKKSSSSSTSNNCRNVHNQRWLIHAECEHENGMQFLTSARCFVLGIIRVGRIRWGGRSRWNFLKSWSQKSTQHMRQFLSYITALTTSITGVVLPTRKLTILPGKQEQL